MVDILNAVLTDGLPAVEAACAEALGDGVHSADVVLNILARQREPAPPANIMTPAEQFAMRRSRPLRQLQEDHLMERTQIFDLMGELKLYGMKAAFDEIMATAIQRLRRVAIFKLVENNRHLNHFDFQVRVGNADAGAY